MAELQIDFENAFALVVGIAEYSGVQRLPKVDDAKDFAALLRDKELCGYEYDHVTILEEDKATKDAILDALDELAKEPAKTVVLIYFSGHGALMKEGEHQGEQYLLPVGAIFPTAAELHDSAISGEEFTKRLSEIAKSTEQLIVILDCCHSGSLVDLDRFGKDATVEKDLKVVTPGLSDGYLASIDSGNDRAVLAAAWKTEKAYVRIGSRHGDFTHHLLEGLKGAARGTRGMIRITDLYDYVQEGLEKDQESRGGTKQKPYFAGHYARNLTISRYLGGKVGSGVTFSGALAVLRRLIEENTKVHEMVGDITEKLQAARQKISTVVSLKSLHMKLQSFELELFNSIAREQRRFPDEESACRNLANWSKQVTTRARRMKAIAKSAYSGRDGAEESVDELVTAADTLKAGVDALDPNMVDDGICGLDHVLRHYPAVVNKDLLDSVKKMDLRELFRELTRIGDEMALLEVSEDDVRTFIAGGRDLGRLDRELNDLMLQHDHWQRIDTDFRMLENNWKGHPRELDFAWPKLFKKIRAELDYVAPSHHDDLRDAVDGVIPVLGQGGSDQQHDAFQLLRSQAVDWFKTLDEVMMTRISEFNSIDISLKLTLAVTQASPVEMESIP